MPATNTLDQIMNIVIPALLIIVVIGFVWTKFIEPWVLPMLIKLWDKMKGDPDKEHITHIKEITYE